MVEVNEAKAHGPGPALRDAREALGISAEEVAGAMNLPLDIVRGLEENDFESLPPPTFTRGYIRSYARLLRLDGDVLIREYGDAACHEGDAKLVVDVSRPALSELPQRRPGWVFGGSVLAVALAGAAALWWAWPEETAPSRLGAGTTESEQRRTAADDSGGETRSPNRVGASGPSAVAVDTPTSVAALPSVEARSSSNDASIPPPDVQATAADAVADVGGEPEPRVEEPPTPVSPSAEAEAPSPVSPASQLGMDGADVIELTFEEDCWVEVYDGEGRVVHMDMGLGGESLRLRGEAPFSLRLGNAGATALAFNGEPVPLAPHTRANVATLDLGG